MCIRIYIYHSPEEGIPKGGPIPLHRDTTNISLPSDSDYPPRYLCTIGVPPPEPINIARVFQVH